MSNQRTDRFRLAIVAMILTALVGCTAAPAPTAAPTAAPTQATSANSSAPKVDPSTLQLVQAGQLTIATQDVQPPFTQINASGQREGFAIDFFDELGKRWGLQVTYTSLPLAALVPALSAAQYDAAAANLSTEGKPGLDFAEPVIWSYADLVVLKAHPYQSMDDMTGKIVGAIQGSVQVTEVQANSNVTASTFDNAPNMLASLRGGQIDAFLVGDNTAQPLVQQNSDITTTQQVPAAGRTGFPVPKGHDAMLKAINDELNSMMADGTFMKMYDKWFTTPPSPKILELYPVLANQH